MTGDVIARLLGHAPRRKYEGDLLKPLNAWNPKSEKDLAWMMRSMGESIQRLGLLCKHYGIPNDAPDKWFWLAINLAVDNVPGCRCEKGGHPGRRRRPDTLVEDVMLLAALGEAEFNGKSVKNAARNLVKRPGRFNGRNSETLRQRYYALKGTTPEGKRAREFLAYVAAQEKNR
jgi:hypothetical protein